MKLYEFFLILIGDMLCYVDKTLKKTNNETASTEEVFKGGKEQKEYVRIQNSTKTNSEATKRQKKLKIQHTEVETTRSTKSMTTETSDQQPTKRYYANILAAGLRKKQIFINITNNKEIPKWNDQEEKKQIKHQLLTKPRSIN